MLDHKAKSTYKKNGVPQTRRGFPGTFCAAAALLIITQTYAQDSSQAPQLAPADSVWVLANNDTLLFHHDGTKEFIRTNGSRELDFPSGKRLYFFIPSHFIERGAFAFNDFHDVNRLPHSSRCILRFRLTAGYSSPKVYFASVRRTGAKPTAVAPHNNQRMYSCAIRFDDPDWYVVEIAADHARQMTQIIARILICVGDRLPLPFDTLQELHTPVSELHVEQRIMSLLNTDRARLGLPSLTTDTLASAALRPFAESLEERHCIYGAIPPRGLQMYAPALYNGDSTLIGGYVLSGTTAAEIAWTLIASPMFGSNGYFRNAASAGVAAIWSLKGLHAVVIFHGKKE